MDLIQENRSKLFGSLSASFTFEEKNTVWVDVASRLSALHATSRNRQDVLKKLSNFLSKHKPLIADKIASMKKTGGGPPGSELTPLEEKIQSIKGKQIFEGIASGVDMTTEPTHFQVSYDSDQMVTSPLFSTDDDQPNLAGLPSRTRKFYYPLSGTAADMQLKNTKRILLEKEEDKLTVIKRIESSLERIESHAENRRYVSESTRDDRKPKMFSALTQPQMHPLARPFAPPSFTRSFPSGPFYPPSSNDY